MILQIRVVARHDTSGLKTFATCRCSYLEGWLRENRVSSQWWTSSTPEKYNTCIPNAMTLSRRQNNRNQKHIMGAAQSVEPVDLKGKVAIITGANTGIGLITAKEIAKMGAHVIVASRDPERSLAAVEKLKEESGSQQIEFLQLDLASFASVRDFAKAFHEKNLPLHILVNNAGVMALPQRQTTKDGLEMQMGINHFGHFLLTNLLLDDLKKSAPSRIVNVSSEGHKMAKMNLEDINCEKPGSYGPWRVYGNSKLSNILFAMQLQKQFDQEKVDVSAWSLHPGTIRTELGRNLEGITGYLNRTIGPLFLKTPEQGALTSIFCAVRPEALQSRGKYMSNCREAGTWHANEELAEKLWKLSEDITGLKG
ncbi:hypothetical protein PROFUN_06949 [Planoprotostelium fungivorum]|uniref:Uncharacterized protein n=1 Tax=Planoprotostelium fungivorum TaxID=1890364 RepID=A0A2P6NN59_9EUKA|nr:hypothetical protein PROFUN_06949 [Planoprotostelium fungivorum]